MRLFTSPPWRWCLGLLLSALTACSSQKPPTPTAECVVTEAAVEPLRSQMSAARAYHTATLLPSCLVLVVGGARGDTPLNTAELYDPATGTWRDTGHLHVARSAHTATLLASGQVLVTGGRGRQISTNTAELYDPATGTWSDANDMRGPRAHHSATRLPSGQVLVVGGNGGPIDPPPATAELYDPDTDTWRTVGTLTTSRVDPSALLLPSGQVLVVGGGPDNTTELYEPASGTWTTGRMKLLRGVRAAVRLSSGKVLAVGLDERSFPKGEVYDPDTGTWTGAEPPSSASLHPSLVLLPSGQVMLVGGGKTGWHSPVVPLADAEVYDPGTGLWRPAGTGLTWPRIGHTLTVLPSGQVLVAGGTSVSDTSIASCEVLDTRRGYWTPTAPLGEGRPWPRATVLASGQVFVTGGGRTSIEVYEPERDIWRPLGALDKARLGESVTPLLKGEVLIAGGGTDSAEVIDAARGTWAPTGRMLFQHTSHTATRLPSGDVLVVGGGNATAEVYNPATNTWTETGSMAHARVRHTATLLPSGRVLVTGGSDASSSDLRGTFNQAEVFDPATGVWKSTSPMGQMRTRHSATLLSSGQVLVTGGGESYCTPVCNHGPRGSAELYDPATETWVPLPDMTFRRSDHTATLLPSGKVLVTGGIGLLASRQASTELFDPVTRTWTLQLPMNRVRSEHAAVLLPSGRVLLVGESAEAESWDPEMPSP